MKTYRGRFRSGRQSIDLHEIDADGREYSRALAPHVTIAWGTVSNETRAAALVILRDALEDGPDVMRLYPSFAVRILARIGATEAWDMTHADVLAKVHQLKAERDRPLGLTT